MSESSNAPSKNRSWLWLGLLLGVILVGLGIWLWQKYDPFVISRPAVKAAKALADTVTKRPLTDEEFKEALSLLKSGEPLAQLSVIAVLQVESERDPTRRDAVLAALAECQASADANVAKSATITLSRMQGKPEQK